jgi:hypothetical protein
MKYKAHVPTEQYGFIEAVFNQEEGRNPADVYAELSAMFKPREGLDEKEFNAFIDAQLLGDSNHIDMYEKASTEQKKIIQTIKRALKRIEARQAKSEGAN